MEVGCLWVVVKIFRLKCQNVRVPFRQFVSSEPLFTIITNGVFTLDKAKKEQANYETRAMKLKSYL